MNSGKLSGHWIYSAIVLLLVFVAIEYYSDPLKRPSFLIWPDSKPTSIQVNQLPFWLSKDIYLKNEWYDYGGATGGAFTALSLCEREGKGCKTLLQARGILNVQISVTDPLSMIVRGLQDENGPSNFTVWYPNRCSQNRKNNHLAQSWKCRFRGVDMTLQWVEIQRTPRVRYTLEGVSKDKFGETIYTKPK